MEEGKKLVSIRIPISLAAEIERIAQKRKMSVSQVGRMLLDIGASCHKDMESVGVIGVVDAVYYLKEAIKEKAKGKQLKLPI